MTIFLTIRSSAGLVGTAVSEVRMRTAKKTFFPEMEEFYQDRKREEEAKTFLRVMTTLALLFVGCALVEAFWRG